MKIRELIDIPTALQLSWRQLVSHPACSDWQDWPEPQRSACERAFKRHAEMFPSYKVIADESGCKARGDKYSLWRKQSIAPK